MGCGASEYSSVSYEDPTTAIDWENSKKNPFSLCKAYRMTNGIKPKVPFDVKIPYKITDNFYNASIFGAKNLEFLKKNEILCILNCCGKAMNPYWKSLHVGESFYKTLGTKEKKFVFKNIKLDDVPGFKITDYFPEAITFIDTHLKQGYKVLVHCEAGISRSVTICLAYLLWKRSKLSFGQVCMMLVDVNPEACPNSTFLRDLRKWKRSIDSNNEKKRKMALLRSPNPKSENEEEEEDDDNADDFEDEAETPKEVKKVLFE